MVLPMNNINEETLKMKLCYIEAGTMWFTNTPTIWTNIKH